MAHPQPVNDTAPPIQSLPHNVEAEAALLGALMIDNRIAEDIQLKLRPEHFFEPLHGRVYEQILRLLDKNMIASPVTLRPLFEADEEMKELGGPSYLAQLTGSRAPGIRAPAWRGGAPRSGAPAISRPSSTFSLCSAPWPGSGGRWSGRRSTRRTRSI